MANEREIELKLELDEDAAPALLAHQALAGIEARTVEQASIYFDTPDGDLRSSGFSLRVRDSKGGYVQTVKLADGAAAGLFDRPEWESPVGGPDPELALLDDTPIAKVLTKKVRKRLAPVIRSQVTRTTWRVATDGGEIELVFDQGEVVAGERRQGFAELELELKRGRPGALITFAQAIAAEVPVRLGVLTKAERGQRLADGTAFRPSKGERIALHPEMSAAAGLAAISYSCLRQFRLNEPLIVATRDPAALHQARVAMRRLRSAFSLFRPVISGDEEFARLREEVRWFTDQLGDARNLDVLMKRVGDGSKPLRVLLEEKRERAYDAVIDALGTERLRQLMLDLVAWIETGSWRNGRTAQESIGDFASEQLDKRWRKVRKGGRRLAEVDPEARHQLRIEIKKLRYAIEFLASLQTGSAAKRQKLFAAEVEDVQEQLGYLNDDETARSMVAELLQGRADRDELLVAAQGREHDATEQDTLKAAERAFERLVEIGRFWR